MKKLFSILFALTIGVSLFLPLAYPTASAQSSLIPTEKDAEYCNPASGKLGIGGEGCGLDDFERFLARVIKYLTIIVIPLAVGMIMYGGFVIMTAGGSEERVSKGKTFIKTALWGVAIALGSLFIINSVFLALTGQKAEEVIEKNF